ncbi:MAG: InlB B-repeat-containing protein [Clostridia bacterium]|nr:InlB B-repeat-containing protein [Clostridia bacterium]
MKRILSLILAVMMIFSMAVMPAVAEDVNSAADLVNLYDFYQSNGTAVLSDGTTEESTTISCNAGIPVTGGSTLYFGPCVSGAPYLATYGADGSFIALVSADDCTVAETLEDGSVIYSYLLPEDAASVWVGADNNYALEFMLTEDQPLTSALMDEYFAINPLTGKSVLFVGDSITHGVKDTPSDHYGWAGRIGTANGMDWINNGESGYSVSTCRADTQYGVIIDKLMETKYQSFDYVMLHGGVNDAWDAVTVGTVTEGYDPSAFEVDTFAGALEDLIYNTYYYYGRKATVGYLCNFKLTGHSNANLKDMSEYFDVAKEICDKWNVRYFDMYDNTKVNADLKVGATTYLPDHVHPNKAGYDILAPMVEGFMKTLSKTYAPDYVIPEDDGKVYNVTFKDDDGTVLSTTTATRVDGLKDDAPAIVGKYNDGIVEQFFTGWEANGEIAESLSAYDYTSDVTFTATYAAQGYGARLEGYDAVTIGNGSTAQELLPTAVNLNPEANGITFIYKVEGADTEIIADNFLIYINNTGTKWPASQWGDKNYSSDGNPVNYLELNNGYYFIYVNRNIYCSNSTVPAEVNSFSIFNADVYVGNNYARYVSDRDPANTNTNATFRMLAVTNDNLQPTVTFHDTEGNVLTSKKHSYTSVTANLGYGTKPLSAQEGKLLTPAEVFALTGESAPKKAPSADGSVTYEFAGWTDVNGNTVDAIYYNVDLYPVYKTIGEETVYYTVTFADEDGTELYSTKVAEGDTPVYEGETPAKAADAQYTYTFAGWDKELTAATADTTYTATYDSVVNEYTVTFKTEDGSEVLDTQTVEYGSPATAPTVPEKEGTIEYTYSFKAWVDADGNEADITNITADLTVYASYEKVYIRRMGDANGDNEINVIDLTLVAQYISQNGTSGIYDLSACDAVAMDLNSNGVIDQIDLNMITRLILNS